MKLTHVLRYFLFASTLAAPALLSPPAQAQIRSKPSVATIPFDFRVGSYHLKAGKYIVNEPQTFMISLRTDHQFGASTAVPSLGVRPAAASKLIFHRYGDQYFLREAWTAGNPDHVTVPESREEKKLRQEILHASNPAPSGNVELALLDAPH